MNIFFRKSLFYILILFIAIFFTNNSLQAQNEYWEHWTGEYRGSAKLTLSSGTVKKNLSDFKFVITQKSFKDKKIYVNYGYTRRLHEGYIYADEDKANAFTVTSQKFSLSPSVSAPYKIALRKGKGPSGEPIVKGTIKAHKIDNSGNFESKYTFDIYAVSKVQ